MSEEMTKETIHGLIEPVEIDHVSFPGLCRMSETDSSRSSGECSSAWTAWD